MSQDPSIFERWGRTVYQRRRLILVLALLVAGLGGVWGTTIFAKVQTAGGFDAPDSQSQHEANLATQAFGRDAGDGFREDDGPDPAAIAEPATVPAPT